MKGLEFLKDPSLGLVKEVRSSQITMAAMVENVIDNGGIAAIEGPVGVGKTLSYLTPAIMAAKKIVVATAKKTLQDQIINKDIPAIAKATGKDVKALVVKGRSNYACLNVIEDKHLSDPKYVEWLKQSKYGDRAEYTGETPRWGNYATADKCIKKACRYYNSCGYIKMKKESVEANVIVINHALLGFEFLYGLGTFVGGPYDTLIVDEAHKFAEGVRGAYTKSISKQILDLALKGLGEGGFIFNEVPALLEVWERLIASHPRQKFDGSWEIKIPAFPDAPAAESIALLTKIDETISLYLRKFQQEDEEIPLNLSVAETNEYRTLTVGKTAILGMIEALLAMQGSIFKITPEKATDEIRKQIDDLNERIKNNLVVYVKQDAYAISVNVTPIRVGPLVAPTLKTLKSVVLTSATLAIDKKFGHLNDVIGIKPTHEACLPAVFNYTRQALLYVPTGVPEPKRGGDSYQAYLRRVAEEAYLLIEASKGNAFVLFTAKDEMLSMAETLEQTGKLSKNNIRLLVQEREGNPSQLLNKFMQTPNSVLFGVKSFWEGVDVQGEKLRLVIIPKLPFPQDNDPIVQARKRVLDNNAFMGVQYADMLTDLRQGTGRLIRSATDRGVVAILDSRIWTKQYGGGLLNSLPFTQRTSDVELTKRYLKALADKS